MLEPRRLVFPHSHEREDEFTFVYRGRIGGLVGEEETEVDEGGFLFKPRGTVHALWNPTDEPAIVIEFISPAGFEHFFEEMGALADPTPQAVHEIAQRYGQCPHPELVAACRIATRSTRSRPNARGDDLGPERTSHRRVSAQRWPSCCRHVGWRSGTARLRRPSCLVERGA